MTQATTDPRNSKSGSITPPDTITRSGIDQSQTPTNYDHIIWVSEKLDTLRAYLRKAEEEGNKKDEDLWTAAIERTVGDRKDADFDDRFWPCPDQTRQSEQISQ